MIRVLVIDDSAVVRQAVAHVLANERDLELVGSAPNPLIAEPMIRRLKPDVLLLDIEMPGMDGLTFLRKQMGEFAIPTVICSTLTGAGGVKALEAMAAGAVATIGKPRIGLRDHMEDNRLELIQVLKDASRTAPRIQRVVRPPTVDSIKSAATKRPADSRLILIGASTGGTQAIEALLLELASDSPPIAIVQHMPERFTSLYATRLNNLCEVEVREARDGDLLTSGLALIAPGGRHMKVHRQGLHHRVEVLDGPPVNRHKPAVDVLFRSALQCVGSQVTAALLTGMGDDGARGLKALRDAGAFTIAEHESTCVVFGMPREAIRLHGACRVLPLDDIAQALLCTEEPSLIARMRQTVW